MRTISDEQRSALFIALSKSIGISEAEVLTTVLNLDDHLATKADLRDLKDEFLNLKTELRTSIVSLEIKVTEQIATLQRSLLFQLLTMQLTLFGLVIAGVKLLS